MKSIGWVLTCLSAGTCVNVFCNDEGREKDIVGGLSQGAPRNRDPGCTMRIIVFEIGHFVDVPERVDRAQNFDKDPGVCPTTQ